ncbi:MAG: FUSC family protein [Candidatus Nanopelagicales bacterium]|nr:FUSC family protein [Candidatus Nanopelagicales bacterium]
MAEQSRPRDAVSRARTAIATRLHDPGHVFLRKSTRAAVLVPLVYWFVQSVLGWSNGALYASFATFSVLVFADLGGPMRHRLRANLLLAVTGVGLVALGSVIAHWRWGTVLATFVVVFAIAYTRVLRGYFAASATAAILPFVLAATSTPSFDLVPVRCFGWGFGALAATAGAMVLWPAHPRSELRKRLADTIDSAAAATGKLLAADSVAGREAATAAVVELFERAARLGRAFDGRLARPGGGTLRDRNLLLTINEMRRLRTVLRVWLNDSSVSLQAADVELAKVVVRTLADCATALREGSGDTDVAEIAAARDVHERWLIEWAAAPEQRASPGRLRGGLDSSFHVRVVSMASEVLARYVAGALDTSRARSRTAALGEPRIAPLGGVHELVESADDSSVVMRLREQWSLRSPWMRTALKTATALSITVAVVSVAHLDHGFWVSLGALVALRLNVSATWKTSGQMVVGTVIGFVLGSAWVALASTTVGLYWLLLPFAVFLAAYTPGAVSVIVGQASFAVFVIALFGITEPATFGTGAIRLLDVVVGVLVALVVSLAMWPRGVTPVVEARLRSGIDASTAFLVAVVTRFVNGATASDPAADKQAQHEVTRTLAIAHREVSIGQESFDLAIGQGGHELAHLPAWTTIVNLTGQVMFVGAILAGMERVSPMPPQCEEFGSTVESLSATIREHMLASIDVLSGNNTDPVDNDTLFISTAELVMISAAVDESIARLALNPGPRFGHEVVALAFVAAWLGECAWMCNQFATRATGESKPVTELVATPNG